MDFIIGGAYQGKLDLAKSKFDIKDEDVFDCNTCTDNNCEIDFSKKCIYGVDRFTLCCVRNGIEAKDYFEAHKELWSNSVIICEDIFCGVVPVDEDLRAYREMTGRLSIYLQGQAKTVSRVFCGLEQRLK